MWEATGMIPAPLWHLRTFTLLLLRLLHSGSFYINEFCPQKLYIKIISNVGKGQLLSLLGHTKVDPRNTVGFKCC